MPASRRIVVVLNIPADKMHAYYSGAVHSVAATATDGRVIHFPANILRPFVGRNGVCGRFEIEFDPDNKFVAIHRMS